MFWVWYLVVVQLVKINIAIIIIAIINTFTASDNDTTKWKLFLKRTRASIQRLLKKQNQTTNQTKMLTVGSA